MDDGIKRIEKIRRHKSKISCKNIGEVRLRWLGHVERKTEGDQL